MIFSLMSSELQDSTYTVSSARITNEKITELNVSTGDSLSVSTLRTPICTILNVTNKTDATLVSTGNYTVSNCLIKGVAGASYVGQDVNVTYTYTHETDNTATRTINDTSTSISGTTEWFDIFIVIGAMIVLILLTVVIITAIRGSGMISEGSSGANTVGTA